MPRVLISLSSTNSGSFLMFIMSKFDFILRPNCGLGDANLPLFRCCLISNFELTSAQDSSIRPEEDCTKTLHFGHQ